MEEVLAIRTIREQENETLCESIIHLQTNQASNYLGCVSTTQPQPKEP
jgi:hypothetical protein